MESLSLESTLEGLILLTIGGIIVLLLGSVLGIVSFVRIQSLSDKVHILEKRLEALRKSNPNITTTNSSAQTFTPPQASPVAPRPTVEDPPGETTEQDQFNTPPKLKPAVVSQSSAQEDPIQEPSPQAQTRDAAAAEPTSSNQGPVDLSVSYNEHSFDERIIEHLKDQWMIWLGGLLVALAGIFLVRYGIEQGLLGPVARVIFSLLVGVALHISAEYFRRSSGGHNALAALAGAGSITLFGAILAALNLYQLISPGAAFAGLVIVALMTSMLALIHGPLLAAMGLLGAYSVPLLVSSNSGNISIALLYVTAVNIGALFLLRFIFRPWLWWGIVSFTGVWWFLGFIQTSVTASGQFVSMTIYLVAFIYCIFAIAKNDWLLRAQESSTKTTIAFKFWKNFDVNQFIYRGCLIIAATIALQTLVLITTRANDYDLITTLLLPLIILVLIRHKAQLSPFAWLALISIILSLLISHWSPGTAERWLLISSSEQLQLAQLLAATVVIFSGLSSFYYLRNQQSGHWASLAALTPLLALIPGYLLLPAVTSDYTWAIIAAILSCCYLALAQRLAYNNDSNFMLVTLGLTTAAHLGYSLAVVFLFDDSTLTLLLASQVLSLAYLRKRFDVAPLEWLIKALVAIVLIRLSANPFLVNYPTDDLWILFTYAACAGFCYVAARIEGASHSFQKWLEVAVIHLICLFCLLLIRYLCNNGQLFTYTYSLIEASLHALTFAILSWNYRARAQATAYFTALYRLASIITLGLSGFIFCFFVMLNFNPFINRATIDGFGPFNELLVAYGLPAVVLIYYSFRDNGKNTILAIAAMSVCFVFVSLQLRLAFNSNVHYTQSTSSAEVYVYTLAWMVLALSSMIFGVLKGIRNWYRVGLGLLLAVIAKLFLVDMSGLQGLLRVASFMGMGLCLLALAYGHRWLQARALDLSTETDNQKNQH